MTSELLGRDVLDVAPALIGWTLLVDGVGGTIVEVEAYREDDPASHSYGGPRGRNVVMFGPPGHVYVYRSYGIHWCMNLVCEAEGRGAAVLIRGLEPTHGLDTLRERRGLTDDRKLCSGPGRLTQAHGVSGEYQAEACVYGRAGLACLCCGGTVKRVVQFQRATYFCPDCQRR